MLDRSSPAVLQGLATLDRLLGPDKGAGTHDPQQVADAIRTIVVTNFDHLPERWEIMGLLRREAETRMDARLPLPT